MKKQALNLGTKLAFLLSLFDSGNRLGKFLLTLLLLQKIRTYFAALHLLRLRRDQLAPCVGFFHLYV